MVVDDDRIYPRDAIETYLHYHARLPEAALCFRGAVIPENYLIQPDFFDSALWDYSTSPPSTFYVDDIWISVCLDRRGIEKYVVPASAYDANCPTAMGHDDPLRCAKGLRAEQYRDHQVFSRCVECLFLALRGFISMLPGSCRFVQNTGMQPMTRKIFVELQSLSGSRVGGFATKRAT